MLSLDEKAKFKSWLKKNTDLGEDSIGDTVSRISRVGKMLQLQTNLPVEDFLFKLGKKAEFSSLNAPLKSQLRKSYKLYHKFSGGK